MYFYPHFSSDIRQQNKKKKERFGNIINSLMNSSDNYTTFDSSIFLHKNSNIEFENSGHTHPAAIKAHYPIYTTKWVPMKKKKYGNMLRILQCVME